VSSQVPHDLIENAHGFGQILFDEPGVYHGRIWVIVSQILLDISKVDASLQKMSCITVPEMSNRDLLVNAGRFYGVAESDLNA
jgi:hypothetical protein